MKYFSNEEIRDIIIAVAVITLVFSFTPLQQIFQGSPILDFAKLPLYFVAVVIAFLLHELAHKFVAMKFNSVAFFKLWPQGVLFALFLMLFGLKFVAAGAVMILPFKFGRWGFRRKELTGSEMGVTALAGPAVNLFFALIFKLFPGSIFSFLSYINAWLYLFNMLPIPPLDGSKVLSWQVGIWTFFFLIGVFLVLPYFL
jgi:Zn-dependent protease